MIGPETSARTVRRIRSAMARGEGHSCDVVNYSKSGRKFYLHLEIQPVRNEAGDIDTFIAILADITARVETERALRRAKIEADAASRAKSEFLASMSHEIRTPMNGVIGMSSLLLDTGLTQQQRDHVNTIRASSEHLLGIINDILDFSKIESGRMELDRLPFELSACLEDTLELLSDEAGGKHLELAYVIETGVPPWILGDISRLRQVLVNLVNNAVKFTPGGRIDLSVRPLPGAPVPTGRLLLEFTVQDTGIGIPREEFGRLFQPFSQLDSSYARKFGGTGIGLAICHRLCALMGGTLRVESTPGEGSRFIFTIETEAVRPPSGNGLPPTPEPLRSETVLCVEDNPAIVRRFELLFQHWGVRFVAATAADQALTLLDGGLAPALVLVDVELLSGEPGANLGARFATASLPVLMLLPSGYAAQQTPFPFGRLATVGKPIRTLAFVRSLQGLLQIPPDPPLTEFEASSARSLAEEIPLSVLLVEDNPVNQKVALRYLEQLGYRADAVANGLEALASVSARDYQLIFMDLQMPEMDGFEASRRIRQMLPAERQPRIIALTANAMQGDRQLCFAAGMDDYITKPLKSHDLAGAIRRQFGAQQTHVPA
jgi:signal transduction histidine kinase/DNA-binding response OmpR family regulator